MRVLAALLLPAAIVLGIAYVSGRVVGDSQSSSAVHPLAISWAGRLFADRQEFAGWLRARGTSYRVWAQHHPGVAAAQPQALEAAPSLRPTRAHNHKRAWVRPLIAGVLALAGGFVLVKTFRRRRRRRPERRPGWERPTVRPLRWALRRRLRLSSHFAWFVRRLAALTLVGGRAMFAGARTLRHESHRLRPTVIERRHVHADAGWYVAACLIAGAIGMLLPHSLP